MSGPVFTPEGLEIESFEDIFNRLVVEYKLIYGEDTTFEQDSPDGQRVGIEAKSQLDIQSFIQWLYSSFDPDFATGVMLSRLGKFSGISPRPATRSTWDLTVNSDRVQTLDTDYTIRDDIGQEWFLTDPVDLIIGAQVVTFTSVTYGAITGLISAVFEQVTFALGVTIDDATGAALVGIDEETPEQFRIRRSKSLQNPAFSTIGSIFAKLANLGGVTDLAVYENFTDTYDATRDIDAHTYWLVVEGGEIDDIVEVIAKDKTGGTGLKGAVVGTFSEDLVRPDGSVFNLTQEYNFDRSTPVQLFVHVTATRKNPAEPIDLAGIANAIATYTFNIGDSIQAAMLYANAYAAGTNFILTDMEVSDDDITYTDELLFSGFDGKFTLDAADVLVTEVI